MDTSSFKHEADRLTETVIKNGYCIGCGSCAAVKDAPFKISMTSGGQYAAQPAPVPFAEAEVLRVCPFSERAENESILAARHFAGATAEDPYIGRYTGTYAGYVEEDGFRAQGSSGGLIKWTLCELLRTGYVDSVVHVVSCSAAKEGVLFKYAVTNSVEEVRRGASSSYYPVEMSGVLRYVREHPGRYAFTGVPCFIKALRLLMAQDELFRERIVCCIGLICGHLKSVNYAGLLGWQLGIAPGRLDTINFRAKLLGAQANQKGVAVSGTDANGCPVQGADIVQNLFGTDYAQGFFKYQACDYCDDIVGETADLSVGDAWLPEYVKDGRGTNIVVVRNPVVHELIKEGVRTGRLNYTEVDPGKVIASQAGGIRHKREGLAYRLWIGKKAGKWCPPKRVSAGKSNIPGYRRKIYGQRMRICEASHLQFAAAAARNDWAGFKTAMTPLVEEYRRLSRPGLFRKAYLKLRRKAAEALGIKLGPL
jgi:coenzyme F420-reducing hydrogenase beta subunit